MRVRLSHVCGLVVLLCAGLHAPVPAEAQRVLLSPTPSAATPQSTEAWDVGTATMLWRIPVGFGDRTAVLTSDGRYVLSRPAITDAAVLRVLDTNTRSFLDLVTDFSPAVAHPRDVAVFGLASFQTLPSGYVAGDVARLDFSGLRTFNLCPSRTTRQIDLSADGLSLLALCDSGTLVVADATTGAVRRTVSLVAGGAGSRTMRATADGASVYVLAGTMDAPIERFDVTTGALLETVPAPSFCVSAIAGGTFDRSRLFVYCRDYPGVPTNPTARLFLFDPSARRFDVVSGGSNPRIVGLSPDNATLHLGDFSFGRFGVPPRGVLLEKDMATATTRWSVPFIGEAAITYAPLAPALGASVSGPRVDLSWTLPAHSPGATRFVLEIGSAPGLSNLGTIEAGAGSTFRATGVPAGTYFVRLRGVNFGGTGAASNELRIDVQ